MELNPEPRVASGHTLLGLVHHDVQHRVVDAVREQLLRAPLHHIGVMEGLDERSVGLRKDLWLAVDMSR